MLARQTRLRNSAGTNYGARSRPLVSPFDARLQGEKSAEQRQRRRNTGKHESGTRPVKRGAGDQRERSRQRESHEGDRRDSECRRAPRHQSARNRWAGKSQHLKEKRAHRDPHRCCQKRIRHAKPAKLLRAFRGFGAQLGNTHSGPPPARFPRLIRGLRVASCDADRRDVVHSGTGRHAHHRCDHIGPGEGGGTLKTYGSQRDESRADGPETCAQGEREGDERPRARRKVARAVSRRQPSQSDSILVACRQALSSRRAPGPRQTMVFARRARRRRPALECPARSIRS